MNEKSVTQNTTYLTLSYIGQKILAFIYFVVVARMIGVEDLGKYTFALGFTTMFAVFVDLGLSQALIRESAKYRDKISKYVSSIITVKFITAAMVYLIVIALVNIMDYPAVTKQLVYLSGLIMAIDSFTLTFWGVFRGSRNLKYESISVVINQVIILAVGFTVLYLKLPLYFLMFPFLLGSLFSLCFSLVSIKRVLKIKFTIKWDKQVLKFLFGVSIPFALIAIFSRIYGYIDTVMLSKIVGDAAVGLYNVAMKIPFALQFIPAALAAAIFPAFSYQFVHDQAQLKHTFDRVMKFLVIIVLPISFGIAFLSRQIILAFYGQEYIASAMPLMILMAGLFFVFVNFPLGSLLNGCNKHITNTKLVGTTMVLNIILNIFLIPKYSFVGAASAFLISHSFLFLMSMIVAAKIIPYKKRNLLKYFVKSFIAAAVMAVVIYALRDMIHFVPLIFISAIIYFIILFLLRGITWADAKYFKETLLKSKVKS